MAEEKDIKSSKIVYYDATGMPTHDQANAVRAERVVTYQDGTSQRTLYRVPAGGPSNG